MRLLWKCCHQPKTKKIVNLLFYFICYCSKCWVLTMQRHEVSVDRKRWFEAIWKWWDEGTILINERSKSEYFFINLLHMTLKYISLCIFCRYNQRTKLRMFLTGNVIYKENVLLSFIVWMVIKDTLFPRNYTNCYSLAINISSLFKI